MTTDADMQAEIEQLRREREQLRRENEQLKANRTRGTSLKVSEKGGVSVYGLGRFPITLYPEQWEKLIGMSDEIKTFIADNHDRLKWKEPAGEPVAQA
jgi:hypothetical protein